MQTWIGRNRVVAVIVALLFGAAGVSGWVWTAEAQGQSVRLVSPPAIAQPQDSIHIMVTNLGQRPARVSSVVAEAADLLPIANSDPEVVPAGVTTLFAVRNETTSPVSFLALVQIQSPGRSFFRVSMQVIDSNRRTQIFTDGFESGGVSR